MHTILHRDYRLPQQSRDPYRALLSQPTRSLGELTTTSAPLRVLGVFLPQLVSGRDEQRLICLMEVFGQRNDECLIMGSRVRPESRETYPGHGSGRSASF